MGPEGVVQEQADSDGQAEADREGQRHAGERHGGNQENRPQIENGAGSHSIEPAMFARPHEVVKEREAANVAAEVEAQATESERGDGGRQHDAQGEVPVEELETLLACKLIGVGPRATADGRENGEQQRHDVGIGKNHRPALPERRRVSEAEGKRKAPRGFASLQPMDAGGPATVAAASRRAARSPR